MSKKRHFFVYTFGRGGGAGAHRALDRGAFLRGLHLELWPLGGLSIGLYAMVALLVPLYAATLGIAPLEIGILAGAGSLLPMLFAFPCGRACDAVGPRRVVALAAAAAAASTLALCGAAEFATLLGLQLGGGFARATCWMGAQAHVASVGDGQDGQRKTLAFSFAAMGGPLVTALAA